MSGKKNWKYSKFVAQQNWLGQSHLNSSDETWWYNDGHMKANDTHLKWHWPKILCGDSIVPLSYLCGKGVISVTKHQAWFYLSKLAHCNKSVLSWSLVTFITWKWNMFFIHGQLHFTNNNSQTNQRFHHDNKYVCTHLFVDYAFHSQNKYDVQLNTAV